MTSDELPDYVVLRAAPGQPEGQMGDFDGRWYDRRSVPVRLTPPDDPEHVTRTTAVATPTGRFEVRDDGAVAEVWEVTW